MTRKPLRVYEKKTEQVSSKVLLSLVKNDVNLEGHIAQMPV